MKNNDLFIVGYARSGTSILTEILNSDPRVCVLGEPNIHFHWDKNSFVFKFNKQHVESNRRLNRASHLSSAMIGLNAEQVFEKLRQDFEFIGAKIAFNPIRDLQSTSNQDAFLDFHLQHFQSANYIFSIREPYSACLSARKLFPNASETQIFLGWLSSFILSALGSQAFPNSIYVPLEWMVPGLGSKLERALGLRFANVDDWLSEPNTSFNAAGDAMPPAMAAFMDGVAIKPDSPLSCAEIFAAAKQLYDMFVGWVDPETLRLKLPGAPVAMLDQTLVAQIEDLVGMLVPQYPVNASDNLFEAANNLMAPQWGKASLTVESVATDDVGHNTSFVLREMEGTAHKSIMQTVRGLNGGTMEFCFKAKPHGRDCCAAQVGHRTTMCFASFDLAAAKVTNIHNGNGLWVLDAACKRVADGWIECRVIIQADMQQEALFSRIYLLNENSHFEFTGTGLNGIQVKDIQMSKFEFKQFF